MATEYSMYNKAGQKYLKKKSGSKTSTQEKKVRQGKKKFTYDATTKPYKNKTKIGDKKYKGGAPGKMRYRQMKMKEI